MNRIPWKATILTMALLLALVWTIDAQAQSVTNLGKWAQRMSRTPHGQYIGCNIAPPASTRCWRDVVVNGRHTATVHYLQLRSGIVQWTVRK